MKKHTKQSLIYIGVVSIIYVLISILEFFIGPIIIDVITDNMWIQFGIFCLFLIIINPIIVAIIASKLPYDIEGLRKAERPKVRAKEEIIK